MITARRSTSINEQIPREEKHEKYFCRFILNRREMYDIDLIYSIFVHKSVYYIQIRFKLNVYKVLKFLNIIII